MSEDKPVEISPEQAEQAAGGSLFICQDFMGVIGRLTGAYEDLVAFTSHVIERVYNARQ